MSIKDKLGLYNQPGKRSEPSSETLTFGSSDLKQTAPFVFERTIRIQNAIYGAQRLAGYLPFRVSGILELALMKHHDAVHPEDLLFLDTETTGLSKGTGTFPFLVGLAYIRGRELIIRQIFMSSPAGENAFLDSIQKEIRAHPFLTTYNGKSFDVPMLRTRLILQRDRLHAPVLHFDLFHILRRLFPNKRLAKYRQKDLERELLAHEREGDIEGAQIPQIYFDYVKYGTDMGIGSILEHNRLDLLGMVFLFLESVRIYTEKDLSKKSLRAGVARLLAKNRHFEDAMDVSVAISELDASLSPERGFAYRDALFRAWLERRTGEYMAAARSYEIVADRCACPYSRLLLARILEFRLGRHEDALRHTEMLLTDCSDSEERSELGRRKSRLLGKIERNQSTRNSGTIRQ